MNKSKIIKYTICILIIIILITASVLLIGNKKEQNTKPQINKPISKTPNPINNFKPTSKEEALKKIEQKYPDQNVEYDKEDEKYYYIKVGDDRVYTTEKETGITAIYSLKLKTASAGG